MSVQAFSFEQGDVVVIEVTPSPFPPVRYKGKTWIRIGPRKAVAGEMEERILIERRSSNMTMFDMRPCSDAGIDDLNLDLFTDNYLHKAIDSEILETDRRDIKEQLAALRFYNLEHDKPTNAGILLFGKDPEYFIPGAYVQFVKLNGQTIGGDIVNEKKFRGNLVNMLKDIDSFVDNAIVMQRPVPSSTLQEVIVKNYPNWVLRELLMNAIMHRDYESNAPIKFYQFSNRIEIGNAGGLYGKARPENFPNENDYRNPVIAEAMKTLGYVNRFNRGIVRVKEQLATNGNPEPVFNYKNITSFAVTIISTEHLIKAESDNLKTKKQGSDKINGGVNGGVSGGVSGGEERLYEEISRNEGLNARQLQQMLDMPKRTLERWLKNLKDNELIEFKGPAKTGGYYLIK
jgi:ATP-dependent DNA helicase RecG